MNQNTAIKSLSADTLKGLSSKPRYLMSKYFYDNTGSALFQEIMKIPEYYLTRCEEEILTTHKDAISKAINFNEEPFSLIELGSGDGQKTKILLQSLVDINVPFHYVPIDISEKANIEITQLMNYEIPELKVVPQTGDYFSHLGKINGTESIRKVILFLGSNIGNFNESETHRFLDKISEFTRPGDKILIGFDLRKSPALIIKAYNDSNGLTRRFNLNLLVRLNRELDANFDLEQFEHHPHYDPQTGEMKSYLISKEDQLVYIGAFDKTFRFKKWEPIFMELSRKFDFETIENLAHQAGFMVKTNFTDRQNYFVDSLWVRE